jgi:hypothetical protein
MLQSKIALELASPNSCGAIRAIKRLRCQEAVGKSRVLATRSAMGGCMPKISIVGTLGCGVRWLIPPKNPALPRINVFSNLNQNADTLSEGLFIVSNPVCRVVPLSHCPTLWCVQVEVRSFY